MADFGKLNFSVAFNPTSAFPLDARCYFESLAAAEAAAAKAEGAGSTNTVYYIGQKLLVVENNTATWYTIQPDKSLLKDGTGEGGGSNVYVGAEEPPENAEVWIDPEAALEDGDVPSIKMEQTETGLKISATNWNGTTTAEIKTADIVSAVIAALPVYGGETE